VQHLTLVIGDHAVLLVERHARQRRSEVADRAVQLLDRHLAQLAGADHAALAVGSRALVHESRDAAGLVGLHLDGLGPEVQVQPARRLAAGVVDARRCATTAAPVDDHDLLVAGDAAREASS
jgi:hypothetical protein